MGSGGRHSVPPRCSSRSYKPQPNYEYGVTTDAAAARLNVVKRYLYLVIRQVPRLNENDSLMMTLPSKTCEWIA
jgi:hypothetical protein